MDLLVHSFAPPYLPLRCASRARSNCADSTSSNINGFRSCVCSECRTMCGSGEYVDGGTYGTCQDCQAGKYGRSEDSHFYAFCTACSSGQYQDTIGSTECHNCPDGTTSSSGADSSSDCTQAIDIKASGATIVAPVVALGAVVVAAMQ